MSLVNALNSVCSAIITNIDDFTEDNCKVGDEAVFAFIQSTDGAPRQCCLVEYSGYSNRGRSEFASSTVMWHITVNAFFMIRDTEYLEPLSNARTFVDNLVQLVSSNPTLTSTVMGVIPRAGSEPLTYARANYEYVFVIVELDVIDNIS